MNKGSSTVIAVLVAMVIALVLGAIVFSLSTLRTAGGIANQTSTAGYFNAGLGFKIAGTIVANSTGWLAPIISRAGVLHSYTNSTTTNSTSLTLAASDIANYETVIMSPNVNSITVTLPASSTLSTFLPTAGDWRQQCWSNATDTAAKSITFAAGTGETLISASTSLAIPPSTVRCLTYLKNGGSGTKSNDISVLLN